MRNPFGWLRMTFLSVFVTIAGGTGAFAQDVCAAADRQEACSVQCCGRKSCPPSCDLDCVKVCVDGCSSRGVADAFKRDLRTLQARCGYPGLTPRTQKK